MNRTYLNPAQEIADIFESNGALASVIMLNDEFHVYLHKEKYKVIFRTR